MSERLHIDPVNRRYKRWVDEVLVEDRALTTEEAAEVDAETALRSRDTNRDTLLSAAQNAIADNTAYLALTSPTNAQNLAQIKALTRQNRALIRLVLSLAGRVEALDTTEG